MFFNLTISKIGGEQVSKEFSEGEIILGSDCADGIVTIEGPEIAPRHVKLLLQPDRLCVEDLNTETGTLVFGCPITGRVEVDYPAFVQIADLKLCVALSIQSEDSTTSSSTTLKFEHPAAPNRRHLMPPTAPDVTGRIYRSHTDAGDPSRESSLNAQEIPPHDLSGETISFTMASEDAEVPPQLSTAVDYVIKNEIARGGMGKIFGAEDPQLARSVALKVSNVKGRKEDAQFFTEAKVLAQMAHPNIVPIYSIGTDGLGRPFYAMKEVKGRTLQSIIKELASGKLGATTTFTLLRLLNIFVKVCDAIAFAHSKGYLHRDLKPENIMIGEFGEVLGWTGASQKQFKNGLIKTRMRLRNPLNPKHSLM